ncbi:MAG: ATP-binding protein [Clostridiales bacterium]|jgi:AAA15 family ATPase/GTPase|nr:ATP-binding protein [Clostridiales bacterium]
MLIEYSIKGFKSFAEQTTVDIKAKNYKILTNTNTNTDNVLKGLMFVGANASGKSNVVLALKLLLDLLFAKTDISISNYKCKFGSEEISLSYKFLIDGKEIIYTVDYNCEEKITVEKLSIDGELILDRIGSTATETTSGTKKYIDKIQDGSLILREIYFNSKFRNNEVLKKWFNFLMNSIYIDLYKQEVSVYRDVNLDLSEHLSKNGADQINSFFKEFNFGQNVEYDTVSPKNSQIYFKRDNVDVKIPYALESLGNQNLVTLLPKFFYVIENGGMLVLDEFSSGFHNDLEELLVSYFMKYAENAQLIFVSHSTNLLSNRLLRPDQIYTVDFENTTGSVINRVSNQQPREGQNLEKMYLGGVFDGLPKYSSINQ